MRACVSRQLPRRERVHNRLGDHQLAARAVDDVLSGRESAAHKKGWEKGWSDATHRPAAHGCEQLRVEHALSARVQRAVDEQRVHALHELRGAGVEHGAQLRLHLRKQTVRVAVCDAQRWQVRAAVDQSKCWHTHNEASRRTAPAGAWPPTRCAPRRGCPRPCPPGRRRAIRTPRCSTRRQPQRGGTG